MKEISQTKGVTLNLQYILVQLQTDISFTADHFMIAMPTCYAKIV